LPAPVGGAGTHAGNEAAPGVGTGVGDATVGRLGESAVLVGGAGAAVIFAPASSGRATRLKGADPRLQLLATTPQTNSAAAS
jgi:hypothetical protein